jgi:flagellar biosynthesis/type III secretory pathway chaperone
MSPTDALLNLLVRQQEVLTRLLELCREERACLLDSELPRLEVIIDAQSSLLSEQARINARIVQVLDTMGTELGLAGRCSLARVMEQLGDEGARYRTHYQRLHELTETVQREARVNWHLAHQALKYVDYTLKVLGRAKEGPEPYSPFALTGSSRRLQLLMDSSA